MMHSIHYRVQFVDGRTHSMAQMNGGRKYPIIIVIIASLHHQQYHHPCSRRLSLETYSSPSMHVPTDLLKRPEWRGWQGCWRTIPLKDVPAGRTERYYCRQAWIFRIRSGKCGQVLDQREIFQPNTSRYWAGGFLIQHTQHWRVSDIPRGRLCVYVC